MFPRGVLPSLLIAGLALASAPDSARAQSLVNTANAFAKASRSSGSASRIATLCQANKLSQAGELALALNGIQTGVNVPTYAPSTTARAYARLVGANEEGLLDGSPSLRLLADHVTRSTLAGPGPEKLNILVVDIGGGNFHTHMRTADGETHFVDIRSGKTATPQTLIDGLREHTADWPEPDVISIGYNGAVKSNAPGLDPVNMGPGWDGFDFAKALGKPTIVINDAAMQALGGHPAGSRMLYYGLGTGLGTTLVLPSGRVIPLEFGHMPSGVGDKTFEQLVGHHHFHKMDEANGPELTRRVARQLPLLMAVFGADKALVGGGAQVLVDFAEVPVASDALIMGDNDHAFDGGLALWDSPTAPDIAVARAQGELIGALDCKGLSCVNAKAIAADLAGQQAVAEANAGNHPALAHYDGGTMLYWPADGKGAALVVGGEVVEIDLSILPFDESRSFGELMPLVSGRVRAAGIDTPAAERAANEGGEVMDRATELLLRGFNADQIVLGEGWGMVHPAGTIYDRP